MPRAPWPGWWLVGWLRPVWARWGWPRRGRPAPLPSAVRRLRPRWALAVAEDVPLLAAARLPPGRPARAKEGSGSAGAGMAQVLLGATVLAPGRRAAPEGCLVAVRPHAAVWAAARVPELGVPVLPRPGWARSGPVALAPLGGRR
ncbi:hypothetical protein ACFVFQ_31855 [Streptomyces sp. NPDC057743]|uniref:hypothetical protein n=1 Tax=Streptomyces sp. NPDC057743 TaxID=3346236 RepID=UPI003675D43C